MTEGDTDTVTYNGIWGVFYFIFIGCCRDSFALLRRIREMGVYLTSADDVVKGEIGDRGIAECVGPCAIANAKEKEGERRRWIGEMSGFPGGNEK